VTCEECRDLQTHEFRSPADLLHAVQVAAAEVDRGVLRRIRVAELTPAEQEALDSAYAASALPGAIRYRFECTVCGDRFDLAGEVEDGSGRWTRQARGEGATDGG
jgi:hypothetical protein